MRYLSLAQWLSQDPRGNRSAGTWLGLIGGDAHIDWPRWILPIFSTYLIFVNKSSTLECTIISWTRFPIRLAM